MITAQTKKSIGIALALFAITLAVFLPATRNDFINFDDRGYVTGNYHVQHGLTGETIKWAFVTGHAGNWHPLTWLSHALDCELFGLNPAGHHLTSVLLHAGSAVILFLAWLGATGALWRSAFVAGFFALHPLRVESVAWAAERKDVLSAFFFMLTLWAYVKWVQSAKAQGAERTSPQKPMAKAQPQKKFYILTLVFFVLGLLSKPMLVTVPFVLLLLDYWPLNRWQRGSFRSLALEKVPFLALAVVACVVTYIVQSKGGNTAPMSLPFRLVHAAISYATYCGKFFWPQNLSVFYPRPEALAVVNALVAVAVLAGITGLVFWLGRTRRYLITGWLWYGVMLGPVCGIVSIGSHFVADRYTYLPGIGIGLMVVWGAAELARRWQRGPVVAAAIGGAALVACGIATVGELRHWRNDETLFARSLEVTPRNEIACVRLSSAAAERGDLAHAMELCRRALEVRSTFTDGWNQLAVLLAETRRPQEALEAVNRAIDLEPGLLAEPSYNRATIWIDLNQPDKAVMDFETALKINPEHVDALLNLANLRTRSGDTETAARQFAQAIYLNPNHGVGRYNYANLLLKLGDVTNAIAQYEASVRLAPTNAAAHCNLGLALLQQGKTEAALVNIQEALRLAPTMAQAHYGAGNILSQQGDTAAAMKHLRLALRPNPDFPAALNELASLLNKQPEASITNRTEAVELAARACKLTDNKNATYLHTLASAQARAGNVSDAAANAQRALELAQAGNQSAVATQSRQLLEQLRGGKAN